MKERRLLIQMRELKGLKQEEIAKLLRTTQQNISMIENARRKPTAYQAKKLEVLFNTPMENLFPDIFLM
ncbi:helix-turn-helix transcriptional regulator [Clostridium sp.]|uniref:helix-turn-helix transcriptional regulator n=1 Tax=Clostridium sp. TaxID=1506 RepID=UPI002FC95929